MDEAVCTHCGTKIAHYRGQGWLHVVTTGTLYCQPPSSGDYTKGEPLEEGSDDE